MLFRSNKEIKNKEIKNILRYPGGKSRAIKILNKYIPADIDVLYSPFFGGGSFEFNIQQKYNIKIYANDKFTPLYNFWNTLQSDKDNLIKYIKKISPDIINLHWINNEMLSIKDISKLKSRLVWLIHDMWPFCGTEHYTKNNIYFLEKKNFERCNSKFFFDLNKWVWKRKKFFFKNLSIEIGRAHV